jgi:hypothetical protein
MVYNTQNYWVFGPFPSSGILENMTFWKLDLFPSSGEGGGEDTYSLDPVSETSCSLEYQTMEKVPKKPVILCENTPALRIKSLS